MNISKLRFSPLAVVLVLSVLLRVGVAFYLGDTIEEFRGGTYDQISYDRLAQRVINGHGFSFATDSWPYARANQPTAFWSYLYTLYLASVYLVVGHHPLVARLLQAVVAGLLMPWLIYRIGRRSFDKRIGLMASAITAIYLYFVHYAGSLMTETFYIIGILWILDVAMRLAREMAIAHHTTPSPVSTRSLKLGLEMGLAMAVTLLLRQVIIFFLIVLLLWLLWVGWRRARLRLMLFSLLIAIMLSALLILPWMVRNYLVFHQLTLPNTNAGFAFFWSNHPIQGTHYVPVLHGISYQELIPPELRHLNEAALDRALLVRGLEFIRADPKRYVLLSLSRVRSYFLFWPTTNSTLLSNVARVLSFGLFLPFMCYGLFLVLKWLWYLHVIPAASRRPVPTARAVAGANGGFRVEFVILFLLFVLIYTGIHLASWANVRYRLPVDAILILFAAYAINDLLDRWSTFRAERSNPS